MTLSHQVTETDLVVTFSESQASAEIVDAVVDRDSVGDILAIEIIGLLHLRPGLAKHKQRITSSAGDVEVAADWEVDAFTFHVRPRNHSATQRVYPAVVLFDRDDMLISLTVKISDSNSIVRGWTD